MTTRSRRRSKSPFRFMHRGGGGSHSPSPARVPSNIATTTIRATSSNGSINGSMNGTATSGSIEEKRASPAKDCQTPDRPRSTASCSSGSSNGMTPSSSVMLEGILATTPSLPKVVQVRRVNLRKRPPDDPISGWGFVLRGTTSEFKNGVKVYTCHVETVKDGSAAMNVGIKEGDQILSIDGELVKDFQHSNVVKIFQSRDKVELTLLPTKFKGAVQVRVTDFNRQSLKYLWSLTMCLQSLEIINVKMSPDSSSPNTLIDLSTLPGLRHLAINHCSLENFSRLEGLRGLRRLESLSLAHNFLTYEAFSNDCPLSSLTSLKRLDLSYNILTNLPPVILTLLNIETLVLVENNISELPASLHYLKKLTTLCIDGNLLRDVDNCLEMVSQLKMVTMADNQFDTEPYCVKHKAYVITGVEGNPYIAGNGKRHQEYYLRRSYSTRGVYKSQESTQIRRVSTAFMDPAILQQLDHELANNGSQ